MQVQYGLQSGEHHAVVHSTHQTFCDCGMFESFSNLVGPRNLPKTVCAIDRLRLWKHCYFSVSFPVVVWSPWVTCLALHKTLCMCAAPPYPQNSYGNRFLILINFFRQTQGACLSFVLIFHILTSDLIRINNMHCNYIFTVFLCFHNNNWKGQYIILNLKNQVLQVPLHPRDVFNIILWPLYNFTDFFDFCHKQMLIHDYIKFGQLSIKDCVNYRHCVSIV